MKKILVVGPSWVGDMVMAQCLFKVIKQACANSEITVLAPPWSMPILARMPEVANTVHIPIGHGEIKLMARYRLGRVLRQSQFAQAIVLPGSFKSALVPWFAKIPLRTGYLGEQRRGLLNDIRKLDKRMLPMNAQRFAALGLPDSVSVESAAGMDVPPPLLAVERAVAMDTAARFGLDIADSDEPIVAMCPGAEYGPAKQWPAEYFAEVANRQLQQGRQVWLFGAQNDREIAAHINRLCKGGCTDLCGRTALGEVVDLMSLATHVVTNDSGLMHIAAAVGCHVVAIYGSSSDVFTPPLTDTCNRLTLALDCSPCFQRECPLEHLHCLKGLRPEMVISVLG